MLLTPRVVDSSNRVMMHITAVHQPGQTQTHHIVHHSAVEPVATHHIVARPVKVDKATQVDVDLENMSKILSGVRTSETIELIPFVDQLGNSLTTLPGTTAIVTSNGTLRLLQQNGATIVGPNSGYVTLAAAPGTLNASHFVTPVATSSPPEEEVEQIAEPDPEPEQLSEQQVAYSSKKQSSSSQSRPYSCDQCNRTFRFIENLQKHIEQGHSEESKPHKCDTCGKRFPHQWNLNRHMQSHTGERPHMCEICNKRFMRAQHLDQHRKVHEGQRYPCDICGKQFTHLRNLQRHKRTHGQKMYACDMCDECFMQPEYLAEHKKLHSNGDYKPDIYTLDATEALHHEDAIHYEQLQAAEPTPEEEQVHIAPATVVTTLPAGAVVSATIPDHQITVHHQQQPHHQHQQEQQVEQDHQGQIMGHHHQGVTVVHQQAATVAVTPAPSTPALEQTVSAAPLVKYKGSSGGSHVCNECGKSFSNPNNLSRHKKNHNAFRPYACGLCDKRFFQVQHLQQHKKCHEGQRYGCEHCGKQFTHPRNLQRHRLIHTGQRPYVCPQCNKAFNQSTHLYKHMNIHQKLPHACRRCGERFRYKTERERHKKAVHSNRDSDGDQKQDYSLTAPVSDSMDDMDDLGDHTDDHMEGLVKLETASSGSSSIPYDGIKMERVELSHARPGSNESYVSYIDDSSSGRETATGTPTSNAGGTTIIAMNYDSKGAITSATIDATALRQAGSSESNGDDQSNSDDIQFQQRYLTHEFISS